VLSAMFGVCWFAAPRPLHSFPTRRSSDLVARGIAAQYVGPGFSRATAIVPAVYTRAGHGPTASSARRTQRTRRTLNQAESHLQEDRKSTRLNSSHVKSSYAVFCLKKKKTS